MNEDQKRMTYRAAERVIAERDLGRPVDPYRLAWAEHWIRERDRCEVKR